MLELFYAPTPNGWKITIFLEEVGLPYTLTQVDIKEGDQFSPEFLAISPNNKIPALIDTDGPGGERITLFESGAILRYLGLKTGQLYPSEYREQLVVDQWLFWQIGGLGPMAGQVSHFVNDAPFLVGNQPYSEKRYKNELNRLMGVMNRQLEHSEFLAGEYSIADIACFPWLMPYKSFGQTMDEFPHLRRWFDALKVRPAVRKGIDVSKDLRRKGAPSEKTKDVLFGQTAEHLGGR